MSTNPLDAKILGERFDALEERIGGLEARAGENADALNEIRDMVGNLLVAAAGGSKMTAAAKRRVAEAAHAVQTRPRLVLLVEDKEEILAQYRKLFAGWVVEEARSIEAAQPFLDAWGARLDLLVLDVGLPDGSGLEVLKRLRAIPGGPLVPVVVATAWGEEVKTEALAISGRGPCWVVDKMDARDFLRERLNNGGFVRHAEEQTT